MTAPSPEQVEEAFMAIMNTLNNTELSDRVWICGGVLLGYAREGKILKHDTDIDFHFWSEDAQLVESTLKKLINSGFNSYHTLENNNGTTTQYTIRYKNVKIDFFAATQHRNILQWTCYTTEHWNRPARQFINQIPAVELIKIHFYGVDVMKPIDHETYLSSIYGNWKKPMTGYTYYVDSKSIISCEPWSTKS